MSREEFFALCEQHFQRDGFVKWSAVARELGVTRQSVSNRIEKAVLSGDLSPEDYERWSGKSARQVLSAERQAERDDQLRRRIRVILSPENHDWVIRECNARNIHTGDLINELIDLHKK